MHRHFFKLFLFVLLSLFLSSCAVTPVHTPQSNIQKLALSLFTLGNSTSRKESMRLSRDIYVKVSDLTKEFKLTSPPLWHNTLVNMGLRKKGLCYHWSDALYEHLNEGKYKKFSFHLVGANIGEYFFEHNAMVVVYKGNAIEEGMVIDPWRDSGKLYFSTIKNDKVYRWVHRSDRGCLQ